MRIHFTTLRAGVLAGVLTASVSALHAQSTAFTYQGLLSQNREFATGHYDVTFWLYPSRQAATPVASNSLSGLPIEGGLFSAPVDFGDALVNGAEAWLGVTVATNGSPLASVLQARTRITPAPRALYAHVAGSVTNHAVRAEQLATAGSPAAGQVLAFDGTSLVWQAPGGGASAWALAGTNIFYNGGRVGIGTSTPTTRFNVSTPVISDGINLQGTAPAYYLSDALGLYRASIGYASTNGFYSTDAEAGDTVMRSHFGRLLLQTGSGPVGLAINNNRVGIGTPTPNKKLTVAGDMEIGVHSADYRHLRIGGGNSDGYLYGSFAKFGDGVHLGYNYYADASGTDRIVRPEGGASRITAAYGYVALLTAPAGGGAPMTGLVVGPNGEVHIEGVASVASLTIRGGADLAEPFPMKEEEIEKGSVVVIDEEHPGRLRLSTRAYDSQVAGIVSGANGVKPGIALRQDGILDQGQNVALTGRVYVKADASSDPIKPGDLLTTSAHPGHAMKVTDASRAHGAILGKAMSALEHGRGLVLVLVSLQ